MKPLEKLFNEFSKVALTGIEDPIQISEMKKAFYAGVIQSIFFIGEIISKMNEEDASKILDNIVKEYAEYVEEISK